VILLSDGARNGPGDDARALAGPWRRLPCPLYTLAFGEELSVGRVQTPTLAMIVERELAIRTFVPEEYREVVATFSPQESAAQKDRPSYQGTWYRPFNKEKEPLQQAMRLPAAKDNDEAKQSVTSARTGEVAWTVRNPLARRLRAALADQLAPSLGAGTRRFRLTVPGRGSDSGRRPAGSAEPWLVGQR